jgi:hypothetical protein
MDKDTKICGDLHDLSPLGWACHGSRYSGGADERAGVYADIVEVLLAAGASFGGRRMFEDASDAVREVLRRHGLAG